MHRLLLTTLVVVLLCLAWSARRDEVRATFDRPRAEDAGVLAPMHPADPASGTAELAGAGTSAGAGELALARRLGDPELNQRLEARVEPRPDLWTALEFEATGGPPAEQVLADAETWVEEHFPEGGETEATLAAAAAAGGDQDALALARGLESEGRPGEIPGAFAKEAGDAADEAGAPRLPPVLVAAVARIESLGDDLPAWCGLLDLALLPAGLRDLHAGSGASSGETAWISDDRGQLIARVEALQGLGLELDPSWPWNSRVRRLYWTEGGQGGLPARQFRLVLEGNGLVPTWTGRLVLLRSLPPIGASGQR